MTNITGEHHRAFRALTSDENDNFALFSCFAGNAPTAAIVAVNPCAPAQEGGEPAFEIRPLIVSITDVMVVTDHDGRAA